MKTREKFPDESDTMENVRVWKSLVDAGGGSIVRGGLCMVLSWMMAGGADGRPRVVVSTDLGGTDFDDGQSMVHLLVHADRVEIEGLISSPYGPGRKADILQVLDAYRRDFPALKRHAAGFPEPDRLDGVTKQGGLDPAGISGTGEATEGSRWLAVCARRQDPRPLWVLVWGGLEDLAQALHDAPEIEPKLRVYFIGGPNKKWSANAYEYLRVHHPGLWMIEANSTYRGWFTGGNQEGAAGNAGFVAASVAGKGALGAYFVGRGSGFRVPPVMKMGDTPSLVYLFGSAPEDPLRNDSWGGRFVPAGPRPPVVIDSAGRQAAGEPDVVGTFGVVDILCHLPPAAGVHARIRIDGNEFPGFARPDGTWCFRFCPKESKLWQYRIESDLRGLDGSTGSFVSRPVPPRADAREPHWWTDDPDPALAEGVHSGARGISRWRSDFLRDFAERMTWCVPPDARQTPGDS